MILEWSSGGYPQGPRTLELPAVAGPDGWELGPPALALQMPEPFVLDAGTSESRAVLRAADRRLGRPPGLGRGRPAGGGRRGARGDGVLRHGGRPPDGSTKPMTDRASQPRTAGVFPTAPPVAVWSPGQPPVLQDDVARTLPAGADVVLRVHYKKTWITEGQEFRDRTAVGLYAADGEAAGIESARRHVAGDPRRAGGLLLAHPGRRRPTAGAVPGGRRRSHGGPGAGDDPRRYPDSDALPAGAERGVAHPLLVRHGDRGAAGYRVDRGGAAATGGGAYTIACRCSASTAPRRFGCWSTTHPRRRRRRTTTEARVGPGRPGITRHPRIGAWGGASGAGRS